MRPHMDVRRLAAIDMWGSTGAPWRRWVILVEFLLGVVGVALLGILLASSGGAFRAVVGWWMIGVAANYLPLSAHGLTLIRPGALEKEIQGVDVPADLRHYTGAQLWVMVPLLLLLLGLLQWRGDRRHRA
ncbi:hypothetical protein [Actinoplanes flavus]|uniref:Uncharacterized protein n=1 Tax=Actinoplanes flavus TaxID=2820290 RepID=A0ABS3UWJ6_9ACTN|nr:hypothetical protein [Actinoplanes flavus]MBO3742970.1 hypothetical protein [Actinoplanes flavus]